MTRPVPRWMIQSNLGRRRDIQALADGCDALGLECVQVAAIPFSDELQTWAPICRRRGHGRGLESGAGVRLDVAQSEGRLCVIEINGFNGAGSCASDIGHIGTPVSDSVRQYR